MNSPSPQPGLHFHPRKYHLTPSLFQDPQIYRHFGLPKDLIICCIRTGYRRNINDPILNSSRRFITFSPRFQDRDHGHYGYYQNTCCTYLNRRHSLTTLISLSSPLTIRLITCSGHSGSCTTLSRLSTKIGLLTFLAELIALITSIPAIIFPQLTNYDTEHHSSSTHRFP